ncbi:5'-nucleotidase C-terminal domain-containing protein [Hymenobacter sp. GOD-10R]|uniref:5'-nucleotidase C-terminal domain-containing protein n=1 Tax=Hymenobacter sp. GOD-10R TaxID=3093922 RepID=UPI002D7A0777|nr:5'-nucleotidase C-terminal domain-containing protein [Hymenobacter sp. GOD-10R]WRQ29760.1 5'-nucleotidase C-terminal domain-containing protein [Hymenobacter sp. GOD-10R]
MSFLRSRVAAFGLLAAVVLAPSCQRAVYQAKPQLAPLTAQPVGKAQPEDAKAAAVIEPYRQRVTQQMSEVLGSAPVPLTKNSGESPLANFVADLQRERASTELHQTIDVGVMTNGGLRSSLPAGLITLGSVFELMPFENELVVLDAPGPVMQQLFDYAARIKMALSNVTYTVEGGKPTNIRIGGQPFNPAKTYTVAISDYLAGGGDNMIFFKALKPRDTGVLLRSAITDRIRQFTKAGQPVTAKVEGRVKGI